MNNRGYFHWKTKGEVLTAYYEINMSAETDGQLLFSSSLWKKGDKSDNWCRSLENTHAVQNFRNGPVEVIFKGEDIGDRKLDDIELRKYIHRHLTNNLGRQSRTFRDDTVLTFYKSIEECWKSRGHKLGHRDTKSIGRLLKNGLTYDVVMILIIFCKTLMDFMMEM